MFALALQLSQPRADSQAAHNASQGQNRMAKRQSSPKVATGGNSSNSAEVNNGKSRKKRNRKKGRSGAGPVGAP
ncbi:g3161 [Coccomyxa elongata]